MGAGQLSLKKLHAINNPSDEHSVCYVAARLCLAVQLQGRPELRLQAAPLMANEPRCVADSGAKDPWKAPKGVRTAPTMQTSADRSDH